MPREVLGLRRAVHRPARPARRQGQAREARAAGPVQDGAPPRLPRAVRGAREGETPDGDRRRGRGPVDDRDAAPKPRDDAPRHLRGPDRKSTRLNSSHTVISYAVFCLKKKKIMHDKSLLIFELPPIVCRMTLTILP